MADFLAERLRKRVEAGLLRSLRLADGRLVDFCSNDYLGFAQSPELLARVDAAWAKLPEKDKKLGSAGSRLIRGNSNLAQDVEELIAQFHGTEAALLFNSGYDANLAVFSALPERADTILYDELCHASIRDGMRLGLAKHFSFRHNDLDHLQDRLRTITGRVFIAVESVYSMDGDMAPLNELAAICRSRPDTWLIVDEAHATGVFGLHGRGLAAEPGIADAVIATVYTFGKALGCHGAAVAGSRHLCDFLVNAGRSFIYTTALPTHSILCVREAYQYLPDAEAERIDLHLLISRFAKLNAQLPQLQWLSSYSAIQGVVIPGNDNARQAAGILQEKGFDVRPILSPTVPAGAERLRICLHAFNTGEEVGNLISTLTELQSCVNYSSPALVPE